jgi:hypothetical protein
MAWLPHIPARSEADATRNFEAIAAQIIVGEGSPEGYVGAPVGVLFIRRDGGPKTTLYVKEKAVSPTDPTGWSAK